MSKVTIYTLIITIVLAIVSICGYSYAVYYVGGMGADLSDMYQKSNDLKTEEDGLNSIKRVAQNADQRSAELSEYILPTGNEGSLNFVRTMEDLTDKFNLKSNTNSIEMVSDENLAKINKEYLSIKMTVNGPGSSIVSFVKKLESLPFNTKITNYSLTNIGSSASIGTSSKASSLKMESVNQQLDFQVLVVKEK